MTEIKTVSDLLEESRGSVEELLNTIAQFKGELESGQVSDWENPTLERFLDAMHAWLRAMRPQVEDKLSWKLVEIMIQSAKIYE